MVVGTPAVLKRELTDAAVDEQRNHALRYAKLAALHAQKEL